MLSSDLNANHTKVLELPFSLVKTRYFDNPSQVHTFIKTSTFFEDFVVRCVRYAFANIPARTGRVFFSKAVALPFLKWRMLRNGHLKSPVHWKEYDYGEGRDHFKGIWIMHEPEATPDFVLYYVHGGGFAMGSVYFYLEFLMVWHSLLLEAGYKNPAVFALEYTLVPDEVYPKQVHETIAGYKHVLDIAKDSSKVCVAGDSAGGCLTLSLLQELGAQTRNQNKKGVKPDVRGGLVDPNTPSLPLPRMATLISPWVTLMTNLHYPSGIDYLDRKTLWKYAHEYAGEAMLNQHPSSPGNCTDDELWKASCPDRGIYVIYGEEEVFAPDIEAFLKKQEKLGLEVKAERIEGGIHAWPVASLFLSSTETRRLYSLRCLVNEIKSRSDDADGEAGNGAATKPKARKGRKQVSSSQ